MMEAARWTLATWAGCKGISRTFRPAGSCGESRTWIKRAAASTAAAEPSSLTCLVLKSIQIVTAPPLDNARR